MTFTSRHAALLLSLCPTLAWAQVNTGVSDERVTLPQAPGSISGVGENASIEGNQGAVQYSVAVEAPPGFAGLTPDVSLSYSSTAGTSVAGVGWGMPSFSIERMTSKGLQKYDASDRFVVDGSAELVQVDSTNAIYRARLEGGFVRYTWLSRGAGAAGYWRAEYPDGRVGYFGADKAGAAVATAQVVVPATSNVFAWHLVLMEDVWGHQMKLNWTKDASGFPLLERIDYLYEGTTPRHSVRLSYEPRTDVISDARPGFALRLTQRLKDIRIFSGTTAAEQIRRYSLEYETAAVSGGATRLAAVSRYGRGEVLYPVKFSFGYSKTLGGACTTNCDKPFVKDMGTLGTVNFASGRALLVDINGDALPDVVFSDANGQHSFFYGKLDAEGRASFSSTAVPSSKTTGSSPFILGLPQVQLMDVNGDGFVDITESRAHQVLCNNGSGDWVDASACMATPPDAPASYTNEDPGDLPVQQDPLGVRFFDYDNDKRIDWLRTPSGTTTEVLANRLATGFTAVTVDSIGAAFDTDPLQLADMNGDGLQDPVELVVSGASVTVQYKLNLGFGKWSTNWQSVVVSGLSAGQAAAATLEDINGDGLADLVSVTGNEVAMVLNVNGDAFGPVMTLTSADLGSGTIPAVGSGTTISYADMNGNGSTDIVWFSSGGNVQYLELFPVRPNLISRIENGLGAVQLFSYGTSIAEQGRDAAANKPWANRVPNATVLVTRVDSYVTLTGSDSGGLHEVTTHRYHSGYYDGLEKQFRGYEGVEHELLADAATDAQEPGLTVLDFDVGKLDPAFAGRQRRRQVFSLATATPALVSEVRKQLALCPLADVPTALTPPVVFVCNRADTTLVVEKDPANARSLEVQYEFDGYGNVIRQANLGVKNLGTPESPRGCEACVASGLFGKPCGEQCLGDEAYQQTTYVAAGPDTGGLWMLGRASRVVSGAVAGMLTTESQTYYDGPEFVGLPAGTLTRGGVTRVAMRFGAGATDFIDVTRVKLDATGNPVVALEPNATVSGTSERRLYVYDAAGKWITQVEVTLNPTTSLRRDTLYEAAFEQVSQSSNWYAVVSGQNAASPQQLRYRYDQHGRLSKVLEPGDGDANPSVEYQYLLADPASRILELKRSSATSGQDLVWATCLDGRGRAVQTRRQLDPSRWQVSGFTEFDARGAEVKVYQPYVSASGDCERAAPQGVPFVKAHYDVLHRLVSQVEPDGSERRFEFTPMVLRSFDEDDTDPASPFAGTPTIEESDGLGRLVSVERTFAAGTPSAISRLEYDSNGRLFTVKDAAGNAHVQTYDLMGRMTRVSDVNSGVTTYEYDAAGNQTRRTDARNKVVRTQYDALNRTVASWDEADEAGTRVAWTWDTLAGCTDCTNAGGRLVQVDWAMGGTPARDRFGYDVKGNHVFQERTLEGHPLVIRQQYDGANRLVRTLYPAGITVEQSWDGASRLTAMPGYVAQVDYTDRNQVKAMSLVNGATAAREYDSRLRLTRLLSTTADATLIFDLDFTRTRAGEVTAIADSATRPERARHAAKYQYDAWRRVTRVELERAEGDSEVLSFTFDNLDGVLSQTSSLGSASRAHVGDYSYDPARVNAVSTAGATGYTYDAAGHLASRGATQYEFDHHGRLSRASRDGAPTGTFGFGAGPTRVVEQEGDFSRWTIAPDFEVRDGIAVVYARAAGSRVACTQSAALASTLLSDLAPATGTGTLSPQGNMTIDISDAWLAQAASAGVIQLSGGPTPSPVKALLASAARRLLVRDVVWLHADHLGSVVASTDGQGALLAEQSFYPTGELRSSTGYLDSYGFTGQRRDPSTGLIHFAYRELDPTAGRWASADPAFTALSPASMRSVGEATAGYAYAANDFANHVDPTGLTRQSVHNTSQQSPSNEYARTGNISQYGRAPKNLQGAPFFSQTGRGPSLPSVEELRQKHGPMPRLGSDSRSAAEAFKDLVARYPNGPGSTPLASGQGRQRAEALAKLSRGVIALKYQRHIDGRFMLSPMKYLETAPGFKGVPLAPGPMGAENPYQGFVWGLNRQRPEPPESEDTVPSNDYQLAPFLKVDDE